MPNNAAAEKAGSTEHGDDAMVHGSHGLDFVSSCRPSRPDGSGHVDGTPTDHYLPPGLPRTDWDRSCPSTDLVEHRSATGRKPSTAGDNARCPMPSVEPGQFVGQQPAGLQGAGPLAKPASFDPFLERRSHRIKRRNSRDHNPGSAGNHGCSRTAALSALPLYGRSKSERLSDFSILSVRSSPDRRSTR
jgi:hypothetical protein